ncbi:unnamed protein product [Penicillium egyptiacum]|uniref:EKC/KEOPS complex subunit BUD32 n=1 Tax=Penicillium egyptiacum TaxID=1303716 RepID=A0A9W4K5C4_9EURO|nr:unnamed protein product [Penicillium egyptiacum]
MEFGNPRTARKREIRTRAPTACQTCRLRKTRCDNARPTCSYCAVQGMECNYPETSPQQNQAGFDPGNPSNNEVLQRLNHIAGLLENFKSEGSTSSTRSLKEGFFELAMQNPSPVADSLPGSNVPSASTASIDDRGTDNDPRILYMASSGENMLRWPIFNKVITEAEKHIRSFLLDSLDNQPRSMQAPRQVGIGSFVDEIPRLCRKYFLLCHRRNPIVDLDSLDRYAKEVTVQGLGWDGPSCQVLLACALASCTSSKFVPLAEDMPANLDALQAPPMSDANLDLAETYFHAAKQRFGFLHTSPTDIQCFLLAGSYHRHAIRPLQAWFCYQQASCRLEVRLRSLCREQWTADDNYHNLESRLYWSCIQAEHEMQSELPLWSSGLESLGYSDPFPKFSRRSPSSYDQMDEDKDFAVRPGLELDGTEEEKGWKFYIGSICNRRTTNDIVSDMWRQGEKGWTKDIPDLLRKTMDAERVVSSWYQISVAGIQSQKDNPDLRFFFRGRYHMALERIYRPAFYLAIHFQGMPTFIRKNSPMWAEVFHLAQKAIDNCVTLIPSYWYQFRHEWIWNVVRASFACAVHILGAVLYQLEVCRDPGTWQVRLPANWTALVRLSIRTLKHWSSESTDLEVMASTLERMYQGTCRSLTMEEYKPPALPSPFNNTTPPPILLTQGAEAHLYKTTSLNPSIPAALKIRPSKPYRHPILDRRLTRQRITSEARCLAKLVREGVSVPAVLALDWEGHGGSEGGWGGAWLMMEWIDGPVVRVVLEQWEVWMKQNQASLDSSQIENEEARVRGLLRKMGSAIGVLHKAGVVHGDLTTSNLMLRPCGDASDAVGAGSPSVEGDIVLIDFGLASQSNQDEDRAVDLYVLERAIGSTHPRSEPLFEELILGYRESYKGAASALKRLEDVRMRGRKRSMLG